MARHLRPCTRLPAGLALAAALVSPASAGSAVTKPQQACVSAMNGAWLRVMKAQDADDAACLKAAADGKRALADCLGQDLAGRVAKVAGKTASAESRRCSAEPPTLAYTNAAAVNGAAKDAARGSFAAIFGAEPSAALRASDRPGATCQAEVAKRHAKLLETWAAEANKAKKALLRAQPASAAALAAGIDQAVAGSAKVAKAEQAVQDAIAAKCSDDAVDALFECDGATTRDQLASCVVLAAKDDACTSLELADDLDLACPGDTLEVGAASRSILPLVNGSYDYLQPGFPPRTDPFDLGIPVPAWDDGRIAVGNGESDSFWVHDDLRATAVAIHRPGRSETVVVVGTDLYMVFRLDAEGIRAKVAGLVGADAAKRLRVIVTATHDHHGPDTAFDVNHSWYEHMTDQVAAAVAEAVSNRQPATLRVAAGEHWFGAKDGTDPQIYDPHLNVLQALDGKGAAIATLVQWNDHPEVTLGWEPPAETIADDCALLGLEGANCRAEGRYFTSDYPGVLRENLQARYGGEVVYMNGPLGVIIGPGGSQVWEVDDQHPLGNQMVAPPGAVAPGGGTDYTQRNLRRTAIIGEQLAAAVERLLDDDATTLTRTSVRYAVQPFYTRLSNVGFRVLLVVDPMTGYSQLGHLPATLYECPALGPKTDATCTEDGGEVVYDGAIGVSYRKGDHVKTAVEYLRIGPVGMMFMTGEVAGELANGLPADFRTTPENWYDEPPGRHAFGPDFTIPGYVRRRMADAYKWTIGLGSDELGYHVPISNFRALCVGDEIVGPGTCQALYDEGTIEFPDSVAGTTCKTITEHPDASTPFLVVASCKYGQALGEATGHYEETNSAGWDLAEDLLNAVAALTGNADATEVNPDFPGWWPGFLPPGDLP